MTTTPHPTAPLIRRREGGGWERLAFGSLLSGTPCYEPYTFDYATWLEKQQRAAKMREELANV
jgi:hypothetical protein